MARPTQQDLFDALEPTPTASPGLVAVPRGRAPLSREQKRFNRLAEQIRDLRAELVRWEVYGTRYNARLAAEVEPAESGMRAAQRRLLLRLEGMLTARARGERLTRFQRDAVRSHVVMLAGEVLSAGPDPEVEALHDAYCEISHAEMERIALEGVLGSVLGDEAVAGNEARDADELMEHAREWIERQAEDQREREAESGRRGRRRAGAGEGGRAGSKRAGARESALGTVREIYRKLVSAIHPDREVDADARTRKTVLMQRANEAYQRDDLMTLLELQIELEQIDAAHLAAAPPERLRHFTTVLSAQVRTLEAELEPMIELFRELADRPFGRLTPEMVDAVLDERLRDVRDVTRAIEADLEQLESPAGRRAVIDAVVAEESEGFDPDHPIALIDALMAFDRRPEPPPRRNRRAGSGKKKRRRKR